MQKRYICIHGHFYQPPRENPWLEDVELQDSAYPYHDWNERITAECYAPNTASRILGADGHIIDIVNNYSKISFNFGPTLLSWMERNKPEIYEAILEADTISRERFSGHGSALAQVYNHMIMPLANKRDKETQVLWGIHDFRKRFGRDPEGMWLAETAVDTESLEILADHNILFTILAQNQAKRFRKKGSGDWIDVHNGSIDPTTPYHCNLPSGKGIVIFFYDGPISRAIAFNGLLRSGESFAKRLLSAYSDDREWAQIVHVATDGETYGHHQKRGDMALAYCLYHIESHTPVELTNYGEYLKMHPPDYEAEIIENSSWSCIHGIERWRDNCGCKTGTRSGWTQSWRKPLRDTLDWLRDRLNDYFEKEMVRFVPDPWAFRSEYIDVILNRDHNDVAHFLEKHCGRAISHVIQGRLLKLLEMQRNAMLMYTSCGWFFDEVSGIETVQILQYASQAIQYLRELSDIDVDPEFMNLLAGVPSNVFENAAVPYERFVKPAGIDLYRVGAHYTISSLFEDYPEDITIYSYSCKSQLYERMEAGKIKLITGRATIRSEITWDSKNLGFAVLNLGDQNINCGIGDFIGDAAYKEMHREMNEAFERSDIAEVIRRLDGHFETHRYTLWHLFRDEQRKIINQILQLTYEGIETSYRQIYDNNYTIMNFFHVLDAPLPKPLAVAAEYVVNLDLRRLLEEIMDVERLECLIQEIDKWSLSIDRAAIGFAASNTITELMGRLSDEPDSTERIGMVVTCIRLLQGLPIEMDLWKAQNIYFSIGTHLFDAMKVSAEKDDSARTWIDAFKKLGYYLQVKVSS